MDPTTTKAPRKRKAVEDGEQPTSKLAQLRLELELIRRQFEDHAGYPHSRRPLPFLCGLNKGDDPIPHGNPMREANRLAESLGFGPIFEVKWEPRQPWHPDRWLIQINYGGRSST